ncbi:MAG: NlpC/P60 family protein [Planctomycetota bacterium]
MAALTAVAGLGGIAILLYPVASTALRLGWVTGLAVSWLGLLILGWERRPARVVLLAIPMALAAPFLLPARPLDRKELRRDYVLRLGAFEGTRYVWGGENALGIDCSGLLRHALRQALFSHGLRHLDGGCMRAGLELWWFDASAMALAEGYRAYTTPLAVEGTIQSMPYAALSPGDLAVTTDGVHVLAFTGGEEWTQADPQLGTVATLNGRTQSNPWFQRSVTLHRWSILDDRGS